MLPQTLPRARILQYGYQSAWFGQEAIQTRTTNIAERFGIAVGRERKVCMYDFLLSFSFLERVNGSDVLGIEMSRKTSYHHCTMFWWVSRSQGYSESKRILW